MHRQMSICKFVSVVAACFLLLCTVAWGQSTSRVTGTVQDKSGGLIPGAKVTLTNEATNVSVSTVTTTAGTYIFDGIVPGTYTVTVEKSGFAAFTSRGNVLTIALPMVVNVSLQVGAVTEKVVVNAGAELVQTETSGNLGGLINEQSLTTLPIVGARGRSPLDLLELTPGVEDGGPMNSSGANIAGGGVSVDGSRDRAWSYTLDGIDITETSAPGSNFAPLRTNPDSITGFRVINTNATADYGTTSGAHVILNTRSGTNAFHGEGFWLYQTPGLDANDPGNIELGLPRPAFVQNILGFDVGGPIFKNKTFFFVNMQGLRSNEPFSNTSFAYTQSARNGLFRYATDSTGCGGPGCPHNAPFGSPGASVDSQGNPIVPVSTYDIAANDPQSIGLDSAIQNLLGKTPLPNNFGVGDGLNVAGFTFLAPDIEKQIDFTVRIDHQFNSHNSIFGRWAHGHQNTFGDIVNGGLQPFPTAPAVVDTFRQPRNLAISWRYTPGSSITNEVIAGMNRFIFNFANPDPNFKNNPPFTLNNATTPLQNYVGNERTLTTIQLVDNLTWIRGAHAVKFGTNLRYERHIDNRGSIGTFDAQPLVFFDPGVNPVDSSTGFNLPADINPTLDLPTLETSVNDLLGRVSDIEQGLVAQNANQYAPAGTHLRDDFRLPEYDFYGLDSWKVKPNLTVEAGLRWEVRLSPRAGSNFLLHPDQPFGITAAPSDTLTWVDGPLYKNAYHNFDPSIGVAWDPFKDGKSSIRANYRLANDSMNTFVLSSGIFQGIPGETLDIDDQTFGPVNGGRAAQGIPVITAPAGQTPLSARQPVPFSTTRITVVDPNWTPPQVSEWSLSFQRQVGNRSVAELSYIGHHAVHLFGGYDANQAILGSNGFLNAFETVQAGNDSPLIDQLLANDPACSGKTGSQCLATGGPYHTAFARGSVAQVARTIGIRTDSSGNPLPVSAGLSPFFFFKYPQFAGAFDVLDSGDWSWYHGLQANYRGSYEALTYQLNYTYSKSLDTRSFDPTFSRVVGGGSTFGSSSTPFDIANRRLNYAPSDFDRTHVFQGIWTYRIPFGSQRKWLSSEGPWLDRLIGGWEVSGDTVIETGRPYTIYSPAFTTSSIVQTPASCAGCSPHMPHAHAEGTPPDVFAAYFTPAQVAQFSTPAPGQFSNVGRNFFRLPGYSVVNLSLGKVTRITEKQSLELRIEMENAFNSTHFEQPASSSIISSLFGVVDSATVESVGLAPGSNPRMMQIAAKYTF